MEESGKTMNIKLKTRTLVPGTVVEICTVGGESGDTVNNGKIKRVIDYAEKKYLVHIKNTEYMLELHDIDVEGSEDLVPPYRYISGAYDKYGRTIE